ncbi:MAG: hypothetical protein AAFP04_04550 [Myxococcota bacterium]
MAKRPVFYVDPTTHRVERLDIQFTWFPGFSVAQKRRSIGSLHEEAERAGLSPVLEVSTKSATELGTALSAFNLRVTETTHGSISLECAFQGSKIFEYGGPYTDLCRRHPKDAKRDPRLRSSGALTGFLFNGQRWEPEPKTAFYDWLYINAVGALDRRNELIGTLTTYAGFTDIEFNPARSINCQARSCALWVALSKRGTLEASLSSSQEFRSEHKALIAAI